MKEQFIHTDPPEELISKLKNYQRIASTIEADWGSIRLDKYFLELVADSFTTSGGKRQGFPLEVFDALTKLQLMNMALLKSKGILTEKDEEDPNSRFGLGMWDLPKNF